MLLVKVGGIEGAIVGYGPGHAGLPMAIVLIEGCLRAVKLHDIDVMSVPKKLRKKEARVKKTKVKMLKSLGNVKIGDNGVILPK